MDGSGNSSSVQQPKYALEDLTRLRKIGRGPKSEVWLVQHVSTNAHYCLKVLDRSAIVAKQEVEHVWNERRILESLSKKVSSFPRCCCLHATMQNAESLYFMLEFIPGAPLHKHFQMERGFDLERARFYCAELVEILGALHSRGIIYRDLKASNVMLDGKQGRLRLVDFGFAKQLEPSSTDATDSPPHLRRTASVCGTFHAMAPEIRQLDGVDVEQREGYTQATDWWSLGVLAFEMITAKPPFGYRDGDIQGRSILELSLESPASICFPDSGALAKDDLARSFISSLLQANPTLRLGACGADEVKAHPWFKDFGWDSVAVERVVRSPATQDERAAASAGHSAPDFDDDLGEFTDSQEEVSSDEFAGF